VQATKPAPSPKPVCPSGEVPVIKNLVMPHGNPDQARSATDIRNDQGGGVTMTIENPSVISTDSTGTGHSLEEMSVQGGAAGRAPATTAAAGSSTATPTIRACRCSAWSAIPYQWLGRFPASIWSDQFEQSQQVQWFGEVAATAGVPPLTQMGAGLFASNTAAAPMSTLCDVNAAAWRCYYYNQRTLFQTDALFYTIAGTGYGAVRLGGPGS
jgi:Neprosin